MPLAEAKIVSMKLGTYIVYTYITYYTTLLQSSLVVNGDNFERVYKQHGSMLGYMQDKYEIL